MLKQDTIRTTCLLLVGIIASVPLSVFCHEEGIINNHDHPAEELLETTYFGKYDNNKNDDDDKNVESHQEEDIEIGVIKDGQKIVTYQSSDADGPWSPLRQRKEDTTSLMTNETMSLSSSSSYDRCDWLWKQFEEHNEWMSTEKRSDRYQHQATDPSTYYRATSQIFWIDFVKGNWSDVLNPWIVKSADIKTEHDSRAATWICGDLHLNNFGAWKDAKGDIVYGMNDFDEGTIHDFQVDVTRLAISIYDQVLLNKNLHSHKRDDQNSIARKIVRHFLETYIENAVTLLQDEDKEFDTLSVAMSTSSSLHSFLKGLNKNKDDYSRKAQISKYAKMKKTGKWRFKVGTSKKPKHKLVEVSRREKRKIRNAFVASTHSTSTTTVTATATATGYKYAMSIDPQSDLAEWTNTTFLKVLDVAERVNAGIGSFGVKRYFVLVSVPQLFGEDPVILDVKHQPLGSYRSAVSESDAMWYDKAFEHDAARATEANRRLTASSDPFTGWILQTGGKGNDYGGDGDDDDDDDDDIMSFTVRERSPWKENFDLELLDTETKFLDFIKYIAYTTAASHVRGIDARTTTGNGDESHDFTGIVTKLFEDRTILNKWVDDILDLTSSYHQQVQGDFECFRKQVKMNY